MRNKIPNAPFEKYQVDPPIGHIEHKFVSRKSAKGNISFEIQKSFFKNNEPNPYPTILPESVKVNKIGKNMNLNYQLSQGKFYPSYNRDYFYSAYYDMQSYQPNEKQIYQKNDMRPLGLVSQSIDNKENRIIKKINKYNKYNIEEKRYPSNYSYLESKYTKKKKNEKKLNNIKINNNNFYIDSQNIKHNPDEKNNTISNLSLTKNVNKSHILKTKNLNNRYDESNSPSIKNEKDAYYYKIQKEKINTLVNSTSENKKRNILLKNAYNEKLALNNYNNTTIKTIVQPRTPSEYIQNKHPIKMEEEKQHHEYNNDKNNNKTERNMPSKSLEKIAFKKLVFVHPKTKNTIKYRKKLDMSEDVRTNITETEPSRLIIGKTPETPKESKIKGLTKLNPNIDRNDKYNNNFIVSITDTKDNKNFIKNINFNTESKSQVHEHVKSKTELIPQKQINNQIKEDKNALKEKKQKKSMIQGIKIFNTNKSKNFSSENTDLANTAINKIKNTENNNDKNRNNNNNKSKDVIEKNKNKIVENKNKYNLLKKIKSTEEEMEYKKEIENIMYDNYTEPRLQIKYNFKENKTVLHDDNNEITNKSLNFNNLSKGRLGLNKEMNSTKNNKSFTDIKNAKINNINTSNNKINNISTNYYTISNICPLEHDKKIIKSTNYLFNNNKNILNILNNNSNTKINNNNINNNLKKDSSNRNIIDVSEYKKNTENIKKTVLTEKKEKSNSFSNLAKLSIDASTKKPSDKFHRYPSEVLKHESRIDEISKKTPRKGKKEEEWDNVQYKGMRKKTYDPGRRTGKKIKNNQKHKKNGSLNDEFSSTVYVKVSEGYSLAGRNEQGNKKTNQDTYVIERNVNGVLNFNIFGVMDGHGDDGHFASQFVSRYIVNRIKNHPKIKKLDEPKEIYKQFVAKGYEIIANIYLDADVQIQKEKFDVTRSGTTVVLVIQLEEHLICANTGDSRAILIYDNNYDDNLVNSKVYPLSYDCKPELPEEKKRIYESGGVVEKAYYSDDEDDPIIPFRVWAKGEDYPGLAMSRSIGDMDAKKVGVIPNPQIVEYTIDYFSKYMLICSDGIWEFINNEHAMKIANKFYIRNDPKGLCHELTQESIKLWEKREVVIDDITVLVVFF